MGGGGDGEEMAVSLNTKSKIYENIKLDRKDYKASPVRSTYAPTHPQTSVAHGKGEELFIINNNSLEPVR